MFRFFKKSKKDWQDEELLELYQTEGSLDDLGMLYDRYIELDYGVCLKYFKAPQKAEDAVMAIFEQLIAKAKTHSIQQFKSWLYVLSKNYCLMELRKGQKNLTVSFDPSLMQSVDKRHLKEDYIENGYLKFLKPCMEALPEQQKRCIKLFYLEGSSYKEIAVQQNLPLGKIRSFIQNGRRNLKNCLEKHEKAASEED